MKRKLKVLLVSALLIGLVFVLVGAVLTSEAAPEPKQRKIVVFHPKILNDAAQEQLITRVGGAKIKNLNLINAKAVYLSPKAAADLSQMPGVVRIEDDVVVEALIRGGITAKPSPSQPPEVLPWGVDRIDADLVWGISTSTNTNVKVAIVDTGIDTQHPDLAGNIKGGVSTVGYTRSYNDDNGHGTHVAGIVAAIDNTIGVIGVDPQIDLYAVKVLDRHGSGYVSDIIEGLQWVIQQKQIQGGNWVVNMSLGTSVYNQSFAQAIQQVNAAGIVQVAAAGNSGPSDNTVTYPAKFPQVIAVSATDDTDNIASWSSRGAEVDLAAPGVNIYSTYKGSTYKTLSGTSMAAPHVTGVAALVLTVPGKCDFDEDGVCSPAEVQKRLEDTAEQVAPDKISGKDNLYGAGLVDAEKAVRQ